jgi:hypothetical protein
MIDKQRPSSSPECLEPAGERPAAMRRGALHSINAPRRRCTNDPEICFGIITRNAGKQGV